KVAGPDPVHAGHRDRVVVVDAPIRSQVPMPTNRSMGSTTRATMKKVSLNPSMPPIRLSATIEPDNVDRNIEARVNDSFHARPREARSDQCSVERIWSRIWTG